MSTPAIAADAGLSELRRHKVMFDNTWTLATVLATALAVVFWYLRLAQFNIGAIIWTLATLSLLQFAINTFGRRTQSGARLRLLALASQFCGTMLIGVSWHLFGGLQQPLFPLLIVLPLLPAALLLSFWQQQLAILALLLLLASGMVLSPDTNSFITQRYGLGIASAHWLPAWVPRIAVAFPDVNSSPPYKLALTFTVAVIGIALSTAARALAGLFRHDGAHLTFVEQELSRLEAINTELIARSPVAAVLVLSNSGRIVNASERFAGTFAVPRPQGGFLLDTVVFAYPSVIKQLLMNGGEEIQGVTVQGQQAALRLRAQVIGSGEAQLTALYIESCDELYWRGEVDALDEPVFVVSPEGRVVFMNHAARAAFGVETDSLAANVLFEADPRWWDIAPLDSARRLLKRGDRHYVAAIRRARIASSIGELSFVHLQARDATAAVTAAA